MKRLFCFLPFLLLLLSCQDEVSLDDLGKAEKMVVYCFPTASDTTYIRICRSVPIKNYADSVKLLSIDSAAVIYSVNQQQRSVEALGNGYYRVIGKQKIGDKISLQASAEDVPTIHATTVIPDTVAIGDIQVKNVSVYNSNYQQTEKYDQVSATFTDDAHSHNYYAVRVRLKFYRGRVLGYYGHGTGIAEFSNLQYYEDNKNTEQWDSVRVELTDSTYTYPEIHTQDENLLIPMSDIDEDFGFSNNFFGNFYIFDDASIRGKTYTLHLNISKNESYAYYNESGWSVEYNFSKAFQVELFRISPKYYRFLQSLNEINNNELARNGFSKIRPTATNIDGGFGVMGGWNMAKTQWIQEIRKEQ
jgi:hypothetical protein